MLKDFFRLNLPFERFDRHSFLQHLRASKHICNVLYESGSFENERMSGITFENVSFSKTAIRRVTFSSCVFKDCLFIGTVFDSVEFHDCHFEHCNFYKSKFASVYGKPKQFRKAITDKRYSNIAVHLYHQLRENYYRDSQRDFKNEAEYYFGHWNRENELIQSKRKGQKWYQYLPRHVGSWLYGYLLGYGYSLRNLVATTSVIIIMLVTMNYAVARYLFATPTDSSLIKTVYFTITTMATLGAAGYNPDTEIGYAFVILNVLIGISIFSATISAILKKVIR
ncbi:MAG: pentapeptide repeat-containing protein [Nitrospiraceae bacterium]|nr:pentapeptide repeat-containing protein [Nitrospiraceae bacterium]